MRTPLALTLCLAAGLLAGCSTPAKRIERSPEAFARLPAEQQDKVRAGEVSIGFDETATRLAAGEPDRITERQNDEGTVRVWQYYATYPGPYSGFCPGYFNGYGYGGFGHGYGPSRFGYGRYGGFYHPGYVSRFAGGNCYVDDTVVQERLRVSFKDGRVTAVERQVR